MNSTEDSILRQRDSARKEFAILRRNKASLFDRGHFYRQLLNGGVWTSQAALALGLGESAVQVSRCLKASRVPRTVLEVFGDRARVSGRTVMLLEKIASEVGEEKLLETAKLLGVRSDLTVQEIILRLSRGQSERLDGAGKVRLVSKLGENYVRLYTADLTKCRRELSNLEALIDAALSFAG